MRKKIFKKNIIILMTHYKCLKCDFKTNKQKHQLNTTNLLECKQYEYAILHFFTFKCTK